MLKQVARQLVGNLIFNALVTEAVFSREPDHVLVWRITARERDLDVLIHLAR